MKQISFAATCSLLLLCFSLSCTQFNHHNISLTVSENEQYYTLLASYNETRQYAADKCLDKYFGKASNTLFVNTRIDGNISLDDGTDFYIRKKPGYLKIKFDKSKNSIACYNTLKAFSNDLKNVLQ